MFAPVLWFLGKRYVRKGLVFLISWLKLLEKICQFFENFRIRKSSDKINRDHFFIVQVGVSRNEKQILDMLVILYSATSAIYIKLISKKFY